MAFEKVTKGQTFDAPAVVWNGFIDAANANQANQVNQGGTTARALNPAGVVLVKNQSGQTISQFGAVALVGVAIPPVSDASRRTFKNDMPFFTGAAYTESTEGKALAIMQEPVAAGKTGKALVLGVTPALVNVSNASHNCATADTANAFKLKSAQDGELKIMWKQGGTGEQLCMVAVGAGYTQYKGIFKLSIDGASVNISDGSDKDATNAGFVFCNGIYKDVPTGTVTASVGYVCLKGVLSGEEFAVSYELKTTLGSGDETTGYYVLGKIKTRPSGGFEVIQYNHATPHILTIDDCEESS